MRRSWTRDDFAPFFTYDAEAGLLTRITESVKFTTTQKAAAYRYPARSVRGTSVRDHIIAWTLYYGQSLPWPDRVDHIDGDKHNLRLTNLRRATPTQNLYNTGVSKASSTGLKGAYRHRSRFRSQLMADGRLRSLGAFDTAEEAHAAYAKAAKEHYGDFARI